MMRRMSVGLVGVVVASVVGAGSLAVAPVQAEEAAWTIPAMQGSTPAPLAHSGELVVWGENDRGQLNIPSSLQGVAVSQVVTSQQSMLALTAAGQVIGWGGGASRRDEIPAEVNQVGATQIAMATKDSYAGAILKNGKVKIWGQQLAADPTLTVPANTTGATQLVMTNNSAVALMPDGSVRAWGGTPAVNDVPAGLQATALAAGLSTVFALTPEGTVEAWGDNSQRLRDLPDEVLVPGNVKAVGAANGGAYALLQNGDVVAWGNTYRSETGDLWPWASVPTSVSGQGVTALNVAANGIALGEDGRLYEWGLVPDPVEFGRVPTDLTGKPIVQFHAGMTAAAIVTSLLPAQRPRVTGVANPGKTLNGVAGTFSMNPAVTSQWHINGVPTGNTAPTLALNSGLVGKTIAYVSTATQAGHTTVASSSAPVTVTAPKVSAPTVVPSTVKVTAIKVAKKGTKVTIAGKVTATKPATGTATVAIKKSNRKILTKKINVPANGTYKLTLNKFTKTALKAIKGKSKKRYRGNYTVTVTYSGNTTVKPSTTRKTFKIK